MRRFFWIRIALFLRQSRWGLTLLALWFALGTILFNRVEHLSMELARRAQTRGRARRLAKEVVFV